MSEIRLLAAVFDDTAEAARWYDEEGYEGLGPVYRDLLFLPAPYSTARRILQACLQGFPSRTAQAISLRRLLQIPRRLDRCITGDPYGAKSRANEETVKRKAIKARGGLVRKS